ncbi:unnamed protein product, partial [Meganyctiphanes norvegica]
MASDVYIQKRRQDFWLKKIPKWLPKCLKLLISSKQYIVKKLILTTILVAILDFFQPKNSTLYMRISTLIDILPLAQNSVFFVNRGLPVISKEIKIHKRCSITLAFRQSLYKPFTLPRSTNHSSYWVITFAHVRTEGRKITNGYLYYDNKTKVTTQNAFPPSRTTEGLEKKCFTVPRRNRNIMKWFIGRSLLETRTSICLLLKLEKFSPREQQNQVTSYLDASNVYGSNDKEAQGLRAWAGGILKGSQPPSKRHGAFLPREKCPMSNSIKPECFEAGDVRVNEQPALTSMHTLWLRVHNNIARKLAYINHSWDDEILYQETRRIVAALHQQITYREFLPIVLGPYFMREFQLNVRDQGYDNSYDAGVDATITNVIATAAFRFGHTLIAEVFKGMGHNVTLRGNFDEPVVLNNPYTGPTALLQGLSACPTRGSDAYLTPTLVNNLLSEKSDPVGFDLMSLNIQRGRDHGLPPYTEWRQPCGLPPVNSFEDLYKVMDREAAMVFNQTYKRVEDIDLFPAGLAENNVPGGLLGPTFSCLIAQQFQALKTGDRFFYENQNQPKPFTEDELAHINLQKTENTNNFCERGKKLIFSMKTKTYEAYRFSNTGLHMKSLINKCNAILTYEVMKGPNFWHNTHTKPLSTKVYVIWTSAAIRDKLRSKQNFEPKTFVDGNLTTYPHYLNLRDSSVVYMSWFLISSVDYI